LAILINQQALAAVLYTALIYSLWISWWGYIMQAQYWRAVLIGPPHRPGSFPYIILGAI
jgi:hypothetical protein